MTTAKSTPKPKTETAECRVYGCEGIAPTVGGVCDKHWKKTEGTRE